MQSVGQAELGQVPHAPDFPQFGGQAPQAPDIPHSLEDRLWKLTDNMQGWEGIWVCDPG